LLRDLRSDALPGSALPDELRKLGYDIERTGESERIMADTMKIEIVEQFDVRVPAAPKLPAPIGVSAACALWNRACGKLLNWA
jgi:hypothetical protein